MAKGKKAARETAPAVGPTTHSVIGASSFHRWKECAGSVRLSQTLPPAPAGKYAEEGTEAHEAGATRLLTKQWPAGMPREMREAVEVYVDLIEKEKPPGGLCLIEHAFDLGQVHPGLYGTCDAVIFDSCQSVLRVYDYKHGAGIPVEVEGNVQLMYYGLGALLSTEFSNEQRAGIEWIELIIVQPRCEHPDGPIRRWKFPAFDLLDFAADLKDSAIATEDPFATLVPGDHCRFCPAVGICPELDKRAKIAAQNQFDVVKATDTRIYDPIELQKKLDALPLIESWIVGLRAFAYTEAAAGRCPPGYKLVAKRGTRKWENEEKATAYLKAGFPKVAPLLFEEPTLKSVAQVEKIIHKNQLDKISHLFASVSSGEVLVPVSDPRPEVVKATALEQFDEVVEDIFA